MNFSRSYILAVLCAYTSLLFVKADVDNFDDEDPLDDIAENEDLFDEIDTDRDGKISKDEFDAYFREMDEEPPEGMFEEEDVDNDGFLS